MLLEKTIDHIHLLDAPSIDGLTFRLFRDEPDYAHVVNLLNTCNVADGVDDHVTLEWATNFLSHMVGFDPRRDILFAEINGQPVAATRVWSRLLDDGTRLYMSTGSVLPQWRRQGIGRALLHWAETRLCEIAGTQSHAGTRTFRSFTSDREMGSTALLEREGYAAVRYGFEMARSLGDPIPDLPLPAGVKVHLVAPEQYRQVYAAMNEAFRDHWGHSEATEQDYQRWINSPHFQPHLWQVGWAGDEVAGMVLNFIDHEYNEKLKRLRGWTDPICVRRPWRKQGLAKALIASSLRLLKERGMTEAGLGVDADNPNGALRLYQSLGFRQTMRFMTYEKPMN
jgi:ribosomal protein S18 acetylase RimI-like enzyme